MGKRDDRLHSPQAYQQALMTRPVAKVGPCVVYKIPSSEGLRLGFVLPKKLIRYAVQRNQIKRWARALFRRRRPMTHQAFALVLRVNAPIPKAQWLVGGRTKLRQDVSMAMEKALADHTVSGHVA